MTPSSLLAPVGNLSNLHDWKQVAKLMEHTLLKPEATTGQVQQHCEEAAFYGFHSVVVNLCNIAQAVAQLRGSDVLVGTVIGFPLGATTTTAKLCEATGALRLGARELDMVINLGALKSGERDRVESEIRTLAEAAHQGHALLKVILETTLLHTQEKLLACQLCLRTEADFVKTSTGFSSGGATASDVALLRGVVGLNMGVKAAGGIRSANDVFTMVEAGANRIGSSSSVAIVRSMGAPER